MDVELQQRVDRLTLEEKVRLLTGADSWGWHAVDAAIRLAPQAFHHGDVVADAWAREPRAFTVHVGRSVTDLRATVVVDG